MIFGSPESLDIGFTESQVFWPQTPGERISNLSIQIGSSHLSTCCVFQWSVNNAVNCLVFRNQCNPCKDLRKTG